MLQKKLVAHSEEFRKITMKVLIMQLASVTIMDLVAFGGSAIGIIISLIVMKNGLDIYLVIFLILVGAEFFIPMRTLGSAFHMSMNGATAGKRILKLLEKDEKEIGHIKLNSINEVDLENVSIVFNEKPILKNINLKFLKNNFYTIIGEFGVGKSTLVKNIAKLSSNYDGNIKINSFNLNEIDNSFYEHICYISTNTHLFNTTIRNNFKFVSNTITDSEIINLLAKVSLNEFASLEGLNFVINDANSNLSGGQKQRLLLAIYLSKKIWFIYFWWNYK